MFEQAQKHLKRHLMLENEKNRFQRNLVRKWKDAREKHDD